MKVHKDQEYLDYAQNYDEIHINHELVKTTINYEMTLFAPPSGSFNKSTIQASKDLGYSFIMWSKDTIDWRDKDANLIYTRATNNIKGGDLILVHPTLDTLKALPLILEAVWIAIVSVFETIPAALEAFFVSAVELIEASFASVGEFFTGIWENICEIFAPVGEWFEENFGEAWDEVCTAFEPLADWFGEQWENVKSALSDVGNWFGEKFNEAYTAICDFFRPIGEFFSGIWEDIKGIFSDIGTAIADGIKGAVSAAVNGVLGTAVKLINGFISAINAAISVLNAIPGVSISKIGKLSVPAMAKGGIVDSATLAMIGENGKEAVVPLENNTEWIDLVASKMSSAFGAEGRATPIILQVDGKTFAETSISSINNLTRQTGQLQLVMI